MLRLYNWFKRKDEAYQYKEPQYIHIENGSGLNFYSDDRILIDKDVEEMKKDGVLIVNNEEDIEFVYGNDEE